MFKGIHILVGHSIYSSMTMYMYIYIYTYVHTHEMDALRSYNAYVQNVVYIYIYTHVTHIYTRILPRKIWPFAFTQSVSVI